LAPDNIQPDFPFVNLDWNADCELSKDNNKDKENSRDKKVTWDRDRYDYLEDKNDGYPARKTEGCIRYGHGRNTSNTQYLPDQN
jgi:hypothetical protein